MHDDPRPDDPVSEAILLGERYRERARAEDLDRLRAITPTVEVALETEPDGERYARGVLAIFKVLATSGRLDEAPAMLRRASASALTMDTRSWVAVTHAQLLSAYNRYDDALALVSPLTPDPCAAPSLFTALALTRATALRESGLLDEAAAVCAEGIAVARRQMLEHALAHLLNNRGGIAVRAGDDALAVRCYEEAASVCERLLKSRALLNAIQSNLSAALVGARRYAEARAVNMEVWRVSEDAHDLHMTSSTLAIVHLCEGDPEGALRWCAIALEHFDTTQGRTGRAVVDLCEATSMLLMGHHDARARLERASRSACAERHISAERVCALLSHHLGDRDPEAAHPAHVQNVYVSEGVWEELARGERLEGRAAHNAVERWLASSTRPSAELVVEGDVEAVRVQSARVDLRRRHVGRRIMRALIEAYPEPVDVWDLFEATWPDAVVTDPGVLNRLYTAIHRLRALGLEDVLIFEDEGYRITSISTEN